MNRSCFKDTLFGFTLFKTTIPGRIPSDFSPKHIVRYSEFI